MMNLNQEVSQANSQRWTDVDKRSANKNYFIKFADFGKEIDNDNKKRQIHYRFQEFKNFLKK